MARRIARAWEDDCIFDEHWIKQYLLALSFFGQQIARTPDSEDWRPVHHSLDEHWRISFTDRTFGIVCVHPL